jgi:hypothetical protein
MLLPLLATVVLLPLPAPVANRAAGTPPAAADRVSDDPT